MDRWVMINKNNKCNNCCYRHHLWYNECKVHVQTLAYTVSIFQLLGRIVRVACGWLEATTVRCEAATLS